MPLSTLDPLFAFNDTGLNIGSPESKGHLSVRPLEAIAYFLPPPLGYGSFVAHIR